MNIWKTEPEVKRLNHELLNTEIADLTLSVRSYNCLKRAGCNTVGDILALMAEDENGLRKIRNLGNKSEKEIRECVLRFQEEYKHRENTADTEQAVKKPLIKPAKRYWDTEIEEFHLSNYALTRLKQNGINYVRDLYATNPKQEPGWYAVRELFDKIPRTPPNA